MKSSGTVLTIYCWLLIALTMAATFTVETGRLGGGAGPDN